MKVNLMGTRLRKENESHDGACPYRFGGECMCKYACEHVPHNPDVMQTVCEKCGEEMDLR